VIAQASKVDGDYAAAIEGATVFRCVDAFEWTAMSLIAGAWQPAGTDLL
jgi:hypothetical protein